MMEKIPTAKDFICEEVSEVVAGNELGPDEVEEISICMIRFAKLHVEAALKAANEKATLNRVSSDKVVKVTISDFSILSAYPPENIK